MNTRTNLERNEPRSQAPGHLPQRALIASGAAREIGVTPLEEFIIGRTAAFANTNFQTDAQMAATIVQHNGKTPHPRSVARCRRSLAAREILRSTRIAPNRKPPGASYRTPYGTTCKTVNWQALGIRDPLPRGERRREQMRQTAIERSQRTPSAPVPVGPRHSSAVRSAYRQPAAPMDREIARMAAEALAVLDERESQREAREDAAMLASCPLQSRSPP